jgi:hypothetical protein
MLSVPMRMLLLSVAGWMNEEQRRKIQFLEEQIRVLQECHGTKKLRFTNEQRRRLAAKGRQLGRRLLRELATIVTQDTILRWQYVQIRQACSVGGSPTRARVRVPVAWIASVKETKLMKSIDKAVRGAASESPGRNASELTGGLVRDQDTRRPSRLPTGEGSTMSRKLTDATHRSGGVVEVAR